MTIEPKFSPEFHSVPDALIDVCLADDVHLLDTFLQEGGLKHINAFGMHDRTALMLAAAWNASQSVSLLLRRGANIHMKDPDGNTALHLAAENNSKKSLQALIHGEALLDDQNRLGYTALHLAAAEGFLACTKELLIAGAQMDLTTLEDGATPLDLALKEGHQSVVLLLRSWDPTWSSRRRQGSHPAIQTWSEAQVAAFLRKLAMSQYVPLFMDHGIDGLALSEMTDNRLEHELHMDRPMHRVRLLEAVLFTQLHNGQMPPPPAQDDDEGSSKAPAASVVLAPVSPPRRRRSPSKGAAPSLSKLE
ncbi:hypothetical protein LEN26_008422 [Aphanomyces euteiches]|nr:hypothetical protein AeMF1_002690 [Aphanomyces euteiches]KAH9130539.1 hypothetical protein LEN26_008422 [Aphanomyces euteiches]KAH9185591.1 hypothetical protein AeNC1_012430 [Aphanomyces euteiches]